MPKQVDADARRREIALGVYLVIADKGLPAVSMRSVAAATGISAGRVQHYFASKEELLHYACRMIGDLAEEGFAASEDAPPRERLRALTLQAVPTDGPARIGTTVWYSFVTASATDPQLAEIILEGWNGMRAAIVTELERARAAGDLAPGLRPEDAADELAAVVDGLVLRAMVGALPAARARELLTGRIDELFA